MRTFEEFRYDTSDRRIKFADLKVGDIFYFYEEDQVIYKAITTNIKKSSDEWTFYFDCQRYNYIRIDKEDLNSSMCTNEYGVIGTCLDDVMQRAIDLDGVEPEVEDAAYYGINEEFRFKVKHSSISSASPTFEDLYNGGGILYMINRNYDYLLVQVCDSNTTKDKLLHDYGNLKYANLNSTEYDNEDNRYYTTSFKNIEDRKDMFVEVRLYKTIWCDDYNYVEMTFEEFKKHSEYIR